MSVCRQCEGSGARPGGVSCAGCRGTGAVVETISKASLADRITRGFVIFGLVFAAISAVLWNQPVFTTGWHNFAVAGVIAAGLAVYFRAVLGVAAIAALIYLLWVGLSS